MENYLVSWSDVVDKFVIIEARSKEDALAKFKNGEGYFSHDVRESDCQNETEPVATLD